MNVNVGNTEEELRNMPIGNLDHHIYALSNLYHATVSNVPAKHSEKQRDAVLKELHLAEQIFEERVKANDFSPWERTTRQYQG